MIVLIALLGVHVALEAALLWRLHAGKPEPKPAAETGAEARLSAEQQAFYTLLQYSPEIAYGVSSMTQEE